MDGGGDRSATVGLETELHVVACLSAGGDDAAAAVDVLCAEPAPGPDSVGRLGETGLLFRTAGCGAARGDVETGADGVTDDKEVDREGAAARV